MIRGIGPVYARKLVRAFAEKVFNIIEGEPDRLREVDGIGPVRAQRIVAAWAEPRVVREIMVFLHSHGVRPVEVARQWRDACRLHKRVSSRRGTMRPRRCQEEL
jgi:exodeoxyribonuclease V alpha subunit